MRVPGIGILLLLSIGAMGQSIPPWSKGANDPAQDKGFVFRVDDIDNIPDLHGNLQDAKLVLFVGGNQFFVMPRLIAGFEKQHPELAGHIFYETLPPGVLRKQIEQNDTITLGNLTLRAVPDIYEAGATVLDSMQKQGTVEHVIRYTTNKLEIMIAEGNPKGIKTLQDLASPSIRLAMPNPETEGVARQISDSLRKAGGDSLAHVVYEAKLQAGTTHLTQVHHRQTPMWIFQGKSDAGVVWASEVRFQQKLGNAISGIVIPEEDNVTAVYAAGMMRGAPHPSAAKEWLAYLQTPDAQAAYGEFGFKPYIPDHAQ